MLIRRLDDCDNGATTAQSSTMVRSSRSSTSEPARTKDDSKVAAAPYPTFALAVLQGCSRRAAGDLTPSNGRFTEAIGLLGFCFSCINDGEIDGSNRNTGGRRMHGAGVCKCQQTRRSSTSVRLLDASRGGTNVGKRAENCQRKRWNGRRVSYIVVEPSRCRWRRCRRSSGRLAAFCADTRCPTLKTAVHELCCRRFCV